MAFHFSQSALTYLAQLSIALLLGCLLDALVYIP
jgi:hypothetical protein